MEKGNDYSPKFICQDIFVGVLRRCIRIVNSSVQIYYHRLILIKIVVTISESMKDKYNTVAIIIMVENSICSVKPEYTGSIQYNLN